MHCKGIVCSRSSHIFNTSSRTKDRVVLNEQQIIFLKYYENLMNPLFSKDMPLFHLTKLLSMCMLRYLYGMECVFDA
jgi:hypothetical protein